jgi:nucleotide-binding universal stress UspA family protein
MPIKDFNYESAVHDFGDARAKASMQEVLARLTGKSNELLSYEEVAAKLRLNVRNESGVKEIPVKAIVGSVGRYTDFTRSFLPRHDTDKERWVSVKAAIDDPSGMGLPPIDVYKVGEVYFVLDGNHRVSVARQEGFQYIQAHVIEVKTDVPLTPDIQPDDLIVKAEYADFLEKTEINRLRPSVDLSITVPGQYEKLLEHIEVHRYFMGLDFKRDISYPEAVTHWYDKVYVPIVEPIRERGLLRWFPGRTETDMYLWVSEHRVALEKELGWAVSPQAAVEDLAAKENPQAGNDASATGSWRMTKMFDRYTDVLFSDILVPINGSPASWQALEQAILIARHEKASLHGLHVVPPSGKTDGAKALGIQAHFNELCQQANASGYLKDAMAIVKGSIADQVCQRALLTDLIVLNVAHPPASGLSSLNSGLRSIIWRSARPILTVPGEVSPMDKALVAFDGGLKSREALFVAAYLAEVWKTTLTVLTVSEGGKVSTSAQDYARSYLELHELQADFVSVDGPLDAFLDVIKERNINLVLMGGYSGTALKEVILGSAVNFLLRKADCPLLICR